MILVLLCQSEAVRLAPAATTPGNATTSKPASTSTPKRKKFHFVIKVGSTWGDKGMVPMEDTIVLDSQGFAPFLVRTLSFPPFPSPSLSLPFTSLPPLSSLLPVRFVYSKSPTIEFECGGVVYDKTLWQFNDEKAFKNCRYKEAKWLHKFQRVGDKWEYSVPYISDDYLYIGPSPWLCKNLNSKFKIPYFNTDDF
ncbi:unnamed protein product [Closterium sp. Yama58-4]|nr:unnamed protein product [Closterium sp. Yama58-4]